jgi:hypothetical protein
MNVTHFKAEVNFKKPMGSTIDELKEWLHDVQTVTMSGLPLFKFTIRQIEKADKRVRSGKIWKWTDGYNRIIITPMEGLHG